MEINLSNSDKKAIVDAEFHPLLNQHKWWIDKCGYATSRINDKFTLMHRYLLGMKDPKNKIDHINGNKLDNRAENLRECSQAENLRNRKKQKKPTSSTFKGVCWDNNCKKYRVRIMINNRNINIGFYTDEKEAAQAYNEAAQKHHGEFANLNIIIE